MSVKMKEKEFDTLSEAYIGLVCSVHLLRLVEDDPFPSGEWGTIPLTDRTVRSYLYENMWQALQKIEPTLAQAVLEPEGK